MPEVNNQKCDNGKVIDRSWQDPITHRIAAGKHPPGWKAFDSETGRLAIRKRWDKYYQAKREGMVRATDKFLEENDRPPTTGDLDDRTAEAVGVIIEVGTERLLRSSGRDYGALLERIEKSAGTVPDSAKEAEDKHNPNELTIEEANFFYNVYQVYKSDVEPNVIDAEVMNESPKAESSDEVRSPEGD